MNYNTDNNNRLFAIVNVKAEEQLSCNLWPSQVHYLFVAKKWDVNNCLISDGMGMNVDYNRFKQLFPL